MLGIGARGPVLLIRRVGHEDGPQQCALKNSTVAEVEALKALAGCRNMVRLYEHFYGTLHSEAWVRLEWMEGGTLRSYLRSRGSGKVPEDIVRFVVSEVLAGLEDMHNIRWMHRDIKAENIGLTVEPMVMGKHVDGHVKLLDFDNAVEVPARGRLSEVIGTVENMAPEVFDGSYDERADCWSLGIVAYEALYRYRPFNDTCIDRIEDMVRNWRKYLMFPSDSSPTSSAFVKLLLTGVESRMTSKAARAHSWMAGLTGGPSGGLLNHLRESFRATPIDDIRSPSRPVSGDRSRVPCQPRMGDKASASRPAAGAVGAAAVLLAQGGGPRRAPSPSTEDREDEVKSLTRLRQGLSLWNANWEDSFEEVIERMTVPLATKITSSSSTSSSPDAEADSQKVNPQGVRPRTSPITDRATEPPLPSMHESESRESPTWWHSNYLRKVRERTNEMVQAAEKLVLKKPQDPPASALQKERPRTPSGPPPAPCGVTISEASVFCKECPDVSARQGAGEASQVRTRTEPSLSHLDEVRRKSKDIIGKMQKVLERSTQPVKLVRDEADLLPPIPHAKSEHQRKWPEGVDRDVPAPSQGLKTHQQVTSAPSGPSWSSETLDVRLERSPGHEVDKELRDTLERSPISWLARHKHRTEKLLQSLRCASESLEVSHASPVLETSSPESMSILRRSLGSGRGAHDRAEAWSSVQPWALANRSIPAGGPMPVPES